MSLLIRMSTSSSISFSDSWKTKGLISTQINLHVLMPYLITNLLKYLLPIVKDEHGLLALGISIEDYTDISSFPVHVIEINKGCINTDFGPFLVDPAHVGREDSRNERQPALKVPFNLQIEISHLLQGLNQFRPSFL